MFRLENGPACIRCVIDDGSNLDRRSIAKRIRTHISRRQTLFGRGGARIRLEFQPPLLPPKGTQGLFSCKGTAYLRDGRHQTPRASNSRSNCIAWRRTNDCIFASRHRVAIGKLVSSRDGPLSTTCPSLSLSPSLTCRRLGRGTKVKSVLRFEVQRC